MRESDTYMAIIDEGREEEAKKLLLLLGRSRFGPVDEAVKIKLDAIKDLDRLERMGVNLLQVGSWEALFETP